jgi:hypothetical protein
LYFVLCVHHLSISIKSPTTNGQPGAISRTLYI